MTAYTSRYAFPYPEDAELSNGPTQIAALAQAVENTIRTRDIGAGITRAKTGQTINNGQGVSQIVNFTTTVGTNSGFNGLDSSTGGPIIKTAGRYHIGINSNFNTSAAGTRAVAIRINGVGAEGGTEVCGTPSSSTNQPMNISCVYTLAVGDVVSMAAWQSSGAALALLYARLTVDYLGAA